MHAVMNLHEPSSPPGPPCSNVPRLMHLRAGARPVLRAIFHASLRLAREYAGCGGARRSRSLTAAAASKIRVRPGLRSPRKRVLLVISSALAPATSLHVCTCEHFGVRRHPRFLKSLVHCPHHGFKRWAVVPVASRNAMKLRWLQGSRTCPYLTNTHERAHACVRVYSQTLHGRFVAGAFWC